MKALNLNFIKERRKELNISLQEMAVILGFKNASTYMKYERGEYSFKADHLPILANKLNCKIELFFTLDVVDIATNGEEVI
ncbi:helix-turn-helix transcriptional regulator [Bacillus sp. A116_S68]|jgi:transcriptional regulator with XRE-family HTH domain|nr:helix-turn-helix transcriptional regulator [Bacillus sp. A116_S68]